MEINFDFVKNSPIFNELYSAANKLSQLYSIEDYRDVISNSRRLLEMIVKKIFKLENLNQYYSLPRNQQRNLRSDTHYLRMNSDYPVIILDLFDEVRRMGNAAIHDSQIEPDKKQAWRCLCDIHDILVFLINGYEGENLYYLRPDIALQASNFPLRKKATTKPQIKLNDHHKKQTSPQIVAKKKTFWQKIKHLFSI